MSEQIGNFDLYKETIDKLDGPGALLVAGDPPNPMTIGWATLGIIWGRPIFQVYVRPTRHTWGIMEASEYFTVCFLPDSFKKHLALCGTRSGRDIDKMTACGFHAEKGILSPATWLRESSFHYECRIIHKNRLDPGTLDPAVIDRYYPIKDFHTVYYGELLGLFTHKNL